MPTTSAPTSELRPLRAACALLAALMLGACAAGVRNVPEPSADVPPAPAAASVSPAADAPQRDARPEAAVEPPPAEIASADERIAIAPAQPATAATPAALPPQGGDARQATAATTSQAAPPSARPDPPPTPAAPARAVASPASPASPAKQDAAPQPEANAAVAPAPPAAAAARRSLAGRVSLLAGSRQSVAAEEAADAVVYFLPDVRPKAATAGRYLMDTRSKGFEPSLLVVPVGSTVRFPNGDPILHSVYSDSPGQAFDLGLYGADEVREHRFDRPGIVFVHCKVHSAMQANILVLDTPHFVRAGRDGAFRLDDVPAGTGTLVAWHPRAAGISQPIILPAADPVVIRLTVTKPRMGRQ